MGKLSDYGFKWVVTDIAQYKTVHILTLEDDDTKEIASIVKTDKEKKFLIEAKCEKLDLKGEQEFYDSKTANIFVSNIKKLIGEELIKVVGGAVICCSSCSALIVETKRSYD